MRILFLDQFEELGGAQRCLLELMPAVRQAGWEAHVSLPGDGPLAWKLRELDVPVDVVPLGQYSHGRKSLSDLAHFPLDTHRLAAGIRGLAERLAPAVLYVNGPRLMPAVAWAGLRLPTIFHAHNCVSARNGKFLVAASLRRTKATVIAATHSVALGWDYPARVIYSGVHGPGKDLSRVPPNGRPRIGLVGRFGPRKCQKEFVAAAAELRREWPDAEFYLCGDAIFNDPAAQRYKREVLAMAPPNVHYLGWRDDVYRVLSNLDLLVAPSTSEGGVPLVILEAFAARVPVLASAVGDTAEVIEDGRNGFLLKSPTAAGIAAKLKEALAQPERLAAVAEVAHQLWRERFTAERYRQEILATIASLK